MPTKHMHYIPECYLRNFSYINDRSNNVDSIRKNGEIKSLSINDVCVSKNLYKLNVTDPQYDSLYLEKFFNDSFENNYKNIYQKLINGRATSITDKERVELIGWCTHLFYRNNSHYQELSQRYLEPIENLELSMRQINDKDLYEEFMKSYQISKKEIKRLTKLLFHNTLLSSSCALLINLINYDIIIAETKSESGFLTSDNPVNIRLEVSANNNLKTYYLQVPLDEKHLLFLSPSKNNKCYNEIQWIIADEISVGAANLNCHLNSKEYLIGKKYNIEKYFEFYEEFQYAQSMI
jgi:hypothetical protein